MTWEHEADTRHLFVDYKTTSDSPIKDRVFVALFEQNQYAFSEWAMKVGTEVSESFDTRRGFRQPIPFFVTSSTSSWCLCYTEWYSSDGLHCIQLLAHADNIDIIRRSKQDVSEAFAITERDFAKMNLAINEGNELVAGNYIFEADRASFNLAPQSTKWCQPNVFHKRTCFDSISLYTS